VTERNDMSNDTNTGGPAFPALARYSRSAQLESALQQDGMTLRDYFAAKAMQGLLSDSEVSGTPEEFSTRAYNVADAMIKARNQ
jgi:hypothetical protein